MGPVDRMVEMLKESSSTEGRASQVIDGLGSGNARQYTSALSEAGQTQGEASSHMEKQKLEENRKGTKETKKLREATVDLRKTIDESSMGKTGRSKGAGKKLADKNAAKGGGKWKTAGKVLGALALGVGMVVALQKYANRQQRLAKEKLDRQKGISIYSARSATAFARLERAEIGDNIKMAQKTEGSVARLAQERRENLQRTAGWRSKWKNFENNMQSIKTELGSRITSGFDQLLDASGIGDWSMFKGESDKTDKYMIDDFFSDVLEGKMAKNAPPARE